MEKLLWNGTVWMRYSGLDVLESNRRAGRSHAARHPSSPLPQPKSAVADFGHFVEWPNPRYSEVRLGRGRGWGSVSGAHLCHISRPPTPTLPPMGEGAEGPNAISL